MAPDLIGFDQAQTAENCNLNDGQLQPWYNYILTQLAVYKGIIKTIHLYESAYWLEWEADIDIVPAPISGDTVSKFYYTGAGIPKKSNLTLATTGSGAMPLSYYPLSVPSPIAALTGAANPPPAGSGDDRYVQYIWTIVTDWSEESYPSSVSNTVTAKNGEKVSLSGMSLIWVTGTAYSVNDVVFPTTDEGGDYYYICTQAGTSGGSEPTWNEGLNENTLDNTVIWKCFPNNLASKRIYRLAVGDNYSSYKYLDAIDITETTYDDSTDDDDLGELCPSLNTDDGGASDEDWDSPPQNLQGIVYLGNGIIVGFVGKDIYACVPYRPWAWPIAYINSTPDDIVDITPVGEGTAIVSTEKGHHVLTGTSSASLTLGSLMSERRPNLSKRGTVSYGGGVIYPATDGLRIINSEGTNQLLTQNYYDVKTWKSLYPATMHGIIHDNKYFGFYQSGSIEGGIVVDLISGNVTTLDFYTFATHVDPLTDTLYFLRSTEMSGYYQEWTNPDARTTTGKATQFDLDATGALAGIVQPDYPRNLVITLTDGDASVTALQITITGTLATGETEQTEIVDMDDLAVGSTDLNEAWAHIDSITVDSVTGGAAADKIDIGWGKKFGLGNSIDASSDVIKVNEDNDDSGVSDATLSTTYNTIQFETDPDAAHDYQVWYTTD